MECIARTAIEMDSEYRKYHMFTRKEMERRHSQAREMMGRRGIDLLFITGEENFQYFAGTTASLGLHHSLSRPSVFLLPMDREPIIVTQGMDNLTLGCYVTDIRAYYDVTQFPHDEVSEAVKDAGLKNNRIGVELGLEQRMGMPVGDYQKIVMTFSDVEFVDAADIIVKLRMVKSSEELVYIRKAAGITARARQRLFDGEIKPGMTERDVARIFKRLILEEGGDRTSFVFIHNELPGSKNQFHYERPLKKGTMLAVDAGAYYWQYTLDYPRFAVLGKATDEQKRLHAAAKWVNQQMADALRPGLTCSELHLIGAKALEDAGVEVNFPERLTKGRMGHGQGMLLTEPPSVSPRDHTVLEEGMVLSTEPGIKGFGSWEEVHVITANGHEQLTTDPDALREIPFG